MLITRITLRVITGYITLDYIIIIRKLIFVNQWSERREHFNSPNLRPLVKVKFDNFKPVHYEIEKTKTFISL